MRRSFSIRRWAAWLTLPAIAVAACDQASESPLQPDEIQINAKNGTNSGVPVLSFADLSEVGTSYLKRTPNGVNYRLKTTELVPGDAYTLWIVIFNDTNGCADGTPDGPPCGPNDVVNADARPNMMYAAGHIAGGSGKVTFAGRRRVGDPSGSANAPVGLPAFGLENPSGAQFILVVHHHGPKLPEYMPDMIKTIDGGCTDTGVPAEGVPSPWNLYAGPPQGAFGRRGPNTCQSVQFAVHSP